MEGHGGRLKKRPLLKADLIAELYRVFFRHNHIFRKAAELPGPDKAVVPAQGVVPLLAVLAPHTRYQRNPRHPVPRFQGGHARADFLHHAGELMPQHVGEEVAGVAVDPRHVGTADAGVLDFNEDLPRPGLRLFDLLIANVVFRVDNSRFHHRRPFSLYKQRKIRL